MARFLLLTFLLLASMVAVSAQTSLSGTVIDGDTKEPIIIAYVVLSQNGTQKQVVETDFDGNYIFSNIDPGTYDVEVSYTGYSNQKITDVQVFAGKSNDLDFTMLSGVTMDEVVVTEYKVPLVEQDNTTSGNTITSEQIRQLPTRSINGIATLTAGAASSDEGETPTIRGSRSNATNYYVDGMRVTAGSFVPESEIDQMQVITGGVEARYGDVTGGIISITTKGPSNKFSGGIEAETSNFLDDYNQNLVGVNLSGPILRKKSTGQSILGYRFSGRYTYREDDDPPAVPVFRAKDEVIDQLEANPLVLNNGQPLGAADFLTNDDVNVLQSRPFEESSSIIATGKIDARLSDAIDITLSGSYNDGQNQFTPGGWRLYNSHNNPTAYSDSYRANFRFRHRLGRQATRGDSEEGAASSRSSIRNATYTLQFSLENSTSEQYDPRFEDRLFEYGHVGTFDFEYVPIIGQVEVMDGDSTFIVNRQVDNRAVLRGYTPSIYNPIRSNYNNLLGLPVGEPLNPDQRSLYDLSGIPRNNLSLDDFNIINGLNPGVYTNSWNFHTNVGAIYNTFQNSDNDVYTFNAAASFDFLPGGSKGGRHNIQLGIAYEQRVNRFYGVSPRRLWTVARQNANIHIQGIDTENPMPLGTSVFVEELEEEIPLLDVTIAASADNQFYRTLRESLGIPLNQFVNIDGLDPSQMNLAMFSAKELNDQSILGYLGYDYLGNEFDGSFEDFFTTRDPVTGIRTFPVAPNEPIYGSAYIQDKFTFKDIIMRLGVRVDRYDANTKVLKDPYSLYEIMGAETFHSQFGGERPGNIGNDFAVYTNADNGEIVQAYRSGDDWFKADGTPTNGPTEIDGIRSGLVFPKYANPQAHLGNYIKSEEFNPDDSFEDYEVQFNVMPRLAFSFPISKDANFFAHYDILVQRPASNTVVSPLDYFYFVERAGGTTNNPNLKPERTVDYEVGFRQRLGNTSAVEFGAYYKEMRNMVQIRTFFPVPLVSSYTTYDNIDFGTVKGFNFEYDMRRTNNLSVQANYTLQFADGTGSDANSQRSISNRGILRTLFPLNFDERHRINLSLDYRYGPNPKNGPRIGDSYIFANAGFNLQAIAVSGRPYTAQQLATEFGGSITEGSLNGARKPWNFTLNMRIDKSFKIAGSLNMNVYLRVSNVLDRRNVRNVYPVTGSPEDSGFLNSTNGINQVQVVESSGLPLAGYLASYQWALVSPNNFTLPRRIYLGAIMDF